MYELCSPQKTKNGKLFGVTEIDGNTKESSFIITVRLFWQEHKNLEAARAGTRNLHCITFSVETSALIVT